MIDEKTSAWCDGTPRDRINGRRTMLWSIGWAATMLLAAAATAFDQFGDNSIAFTVAGISVVFGVGTVGAFRRFLLETDELRQKIELEALAVAMGVGVVGGMAYSQVVQALELGEPNLTYVIAAMLVSRSIAVVAGLRRYS